MTRTTPITAEEISRKPKPDRLLAILERNAASVHEPELAQRLRAMRERRG
jgi:hypothetical protein